MPPFANKPAGDAAGWEPQVADSRQAHTSSGFPVVGQRGWGAAG
jgi:hypothetical protein